MKHNKQLIITVLSTFLLTSCGGDFYDTGLPGSKKLASIRIADATTTFYTGDVYEDKVTYSVYAVYTNGDEKALTADEYEMVVNNFASVDGYDCSADSGVLKAGLYTSAFTVIYTENDVTRIAVQNATNEFKSVYREGGDTCTGIAAINNNVIVPNKTISEQLDVTVTMTWQNHGKEEIVIDDTYDGGDFTFVLHTKDSTTDITSSLLEEDIEYVLDVKYKSFTANIAFSAAAGYKKIDKSELTILPTDFNGAYAPAITNSRVYVIPFNLQSDDTSVQAQLQDWDETSLAALAKSYEDAYVPYYEGLGIHFDVTIGDVYTETREALKAEIVSAQTKPYTFLFSVFAEAFAQARNTQDSEYWKAFDINSDGQIDNIHFISNYTGSSWGSALWPHQSQTFNQTGTVDKIVANSYTLNTITRAINSEDYTGVHEEGHNLGLLDYYDYSDNGNSPINYIGNVDMQSSNTFDWNSYSKLACGLVSPYVVTGYDDDVTIEIEPAATSGDCIIIPADYETWNGSAYDEYFLVELFAKVGNNAKFWDSNPNISSQDYGVRVYHVDSRLYNQLTQSEADPDKTTWPNLGVSIGTNNCSDYSALGIGSPSVWGDYKQLCLIQKGGVDTFGYESGRHYLTTDDMFYAGDSMNFDTFRQFLSKEHSAVSTMDNGEEFPWTIEVTAASSTSASIRIHK